MKKENDVFEPFERACNLIILMQKVTSSFPSEETFGITLRLKRKAIAVSEHISGMMNALKMDEFGCRRKQIFKAIREVAVNLEAAKENGYVTEDARADILSEYDIIERSLAGLTFSTQTH